MERYLRFLLYGASITLIACSIITILFNSPVYLLVALILVGISVVVTAAFFKPENMPIWSKKRELVQQIAFWSSLVFFSVPYYYCFAFGLYLIGEVRMFIQRKRNMQPLGIVPLVLLLSWISVSTLEPDKVIPRLVRIMTLSIAIIALIIRLIILIKQKREIHKQGDGPSSSSLGK